jgi:hypothetical protein
MKVRVWGTAAASGGMALLAMLAYQALSPRPPSLPAGSIAALDIEIEGTPRGPGAVKITSADRSKIESLAAVLRQATSAGDHKCSSTGKLTFAMKDGSAAFFGFLPGHDRRYYEFRAPSENGYKVFRIDRRAFLRAMAALGVDRFRLQVDDPD